MIIIDERVDKFLFQSLANFFQFKTVHHRNWIPLTPNISIFHLITRNEFKKF